MLIKLDVKKLKFCFISVMIGLIPNGVSLAQSDGKAPILFPPPPRVAPPPPMPKKKEKNETYYKSLKQKLQDEKSSKIEKEKTKMEAQLNELSTKNRDLNWQFGLSFSYPFVKTTGQRRQNYVTEPGANLRFAGKIGQELQKNKMSLWTGFRLVNFGGHGEYRNRRGRFDFIYFGPMIGFGWFDGEYYPPASTEARSNESIPNSLIWKNAFQIWMGLAGASRQGKTESYYHDLEGDFATKTLLFDGTGLWIEMQFSKIYYQALSFDTLVGIQTGESKIFAYLAFGMGLWH